MDPYQLIRFHLNFCTWKITINVTARITWSFMWAVEKSIGEKVTLISNSLLPSTIPKTSKKGKSLASLWLTVLKCNHKKLWCKYGWLQHFPNDTRHFISKEWNRNRVFADSGWQSNCLFIFYYQTCVNFFLKMRDVKIEWCFDGCMLQSSFYLFN